jgi:hypothetical protein
MDPVSRAHFETEVLDRLDALASATDAVRAAVAAIPADPNDPWLAELNDGAAVDAARAHFAAALWRAADVFGTQGNDGGYLARAQQALADGQAIVARRHAALHWSAPSTLLVRGYNPTLYRFGYLYFADSLCYWQRELSQLMSLLTGAPDTSPSCFLVS